MTGILREADELMKSSIESQSIRVGGLLLEIHRRRSCKESVPSRGAAAGSASEAREKIAFEKPVGRVKRMLQIERDMKVVETSAEHFAVDKLDKLRNLKRFVQIARLSGQPNSGEGTEKKERRKGLGIELIY